MEDAPAPFLNVRTFVPHIGIVRLTSDLGSATASSAKSQFLDASLRAVAAKLARIPVSCLIFETERFA